MKKNIWVIVLIVLLIASFASGFYFANNDGFSKEEEKQSDEEIVESMAKKYMRAYEKLDSESIIKLMYKDQSYDYEDSLESSFEYLDENDFYLKEWEITDIKKIEGDKLEDFQDDFEDEYDVKPSKLFRVKVKIKFKLDDETDTDKTEIYFAKIKGKWYYVMG